MEQEHTLSSESSKSLSHSEIYSQALTNKQVEELQKEFGLNVFVNKKRQSAVSTFLEEFKSPLIIMLLIAAVISFLTGSNISGSLIIFIVLTSSILDFWVSFKSQKAAESLALQIEPKTVAIRNGLEANISVQDLVPGDIVVLEAGNVVPADGIVIDERDFFVNESSLTGESAPVEKMKNSDVYLGSGVITGRSYIKVIATGKNTKFYGIVALLSQKERVTEFEKGIKDFSLLITKVAIAMAVFVFLVNSLYHHDYLQSLIFSLALAVGITPELLPMIIAVNVSKASIKMSQNGVIVKKLSAIENFGGMDILCTDKTGTLTEDRISVVRYLDAAGKDSLDLLKLGYVSSCFHTGSKAPLDDAISKYKDFDITDYTKIDEVPFDFERRRESIVFDHEGVRTLVSKGAPESLFDVSKLSGEQKKIITDVFEDLSSNGYRVLGIASKKVSSSIDRYTTVDEKDLDFNGFIAFIDPPKPEVKEVLQELEDKHIEIKIITGDHRKVAEKIAFEVGIVSKGTLEASEVDALTDEELSNKAEQTTIFTRVTPIQKNRIIAALQSKGHTVGYMGDGINDAPALRNADVGISVDNATDVAKEAADIILLTKSLKQLVRGVTEGRKTFANTVKYISMAVSSNFGNMFSMTGATLFLPFLPMLPAQILLTNLLYESSQFTLTLDNVDNEIINQPNPWDIAFIKRFMITFGIISSVFDFATFFVLFKVFNLTEGAFQTGWFIESFASQTLVIFIIRTHKSIFKGVKPHISLVLSSCSAVLIAWIIGLSPIGKIFGFTQLTPWVITTVIFILIGYFVTVEVAKKIFYAKGGLKGFKRA
jgi:Mg2+-importing ATPase